MRVQLALSLANELSGSGSQSATASPDVERAVREEIEAIRSHKRLLELNAVTDARESSFSLSLSVLGESNAASRDRAEVLDDVD